MSYKDGKLPFKSHRGEQTLKDTTRSILSEIHAKISTECTVAKDLKAQMSEKDPPRADNFTPSEMKAMNGLLTAIEDAERVFDGEKRNARQMLTLKVPLGLPYKEARLRAMREFQFAYCSELVEQEGSTNAAAKRAKFDQSNFRRILRTAQIDLGEVRDL